MRINVGGQRIRDFATLNLTGVTASRPTGPPSWVQDETTGEPLLEIPFDVEPSTLEQQQITDLLLGTNEVEATLRQRLRQAYTANNNFLALTTVTNADLTAQIRRLTRENNALIRLAIRALDSTDGT